MAAQRNSTRQRLVHAALELFAVQGVTETTTKQIAELADVNEVTIFRQFGNKHGLLLAVIEEAGIFTNLGQNLVQQASQTSSIYQALKDYATACLQALEGIPEVVRSVVGESGQYPSQNREALGQGFTQANRYVAEYFATVINSGQLQTHLPAEKLASLLNGMLLGYAVIEFTSEFHELWQNREDFLENLVTLFLHGAVSQAPQSPIVSVEKVSDLPATLVHSILQRAKKVGLQDYALMYVLFGAGLSAAEVVRLERSHYIKDTHQQLLQITQEHIRQVPLNQWIMGKRYGSYQRNPLTQWLKSRKDRQSALFLNENGNPLSEIELQKKWLALTADLLTPDGQIPNIEQAQQTWCVDMLLRGIDLQNLSILTGWDTTKLQRYVHRAKEKAALEQATRLDQKI
ncbi:TetR family transcriptional regulator [Aerosakkonemataceae cyanobacterium BLCC-F50]|uniref:TetR family transcriptional regulator n=1 Tax=Floridaenema flaviceps BLCC-F50 TaxID=3153642 RepID=A0ABV4XZI8_9CYAN